MTFQKEPKHPRFRGSYSRFFSKKKYRMHIPFKKSNPGMIVKQLLGSKEMQLANYPFETVCKIQLKPLPSRSHHGIAGPRCPCNLLSSVLYKTSPTPTSPHHHPHPPVSPIRNRIASSRSCACVRERASDSPTQLPPPLLLTSPAAAATASLPSLGFRRDVSPAERAGADAEGELQAVGGRGGEPPPPRGPDGGHPQGQARGEPPEEAPRRVRRRRPADEPLVRAPAEGSLRRPSLARSLDRSNPI